MRVRKRYAIESEIGKLADTEKKRRKRKQIPHTAKMRRVRDDEGGGACSDAPP